MRLFINQVIALVVTTSVVISATGLVITASFPENARESNLMNQVD